MAKQKQITDDDLNLLAELGVEVEAPPPVKRSPKEERIIAGFEEIERFVKENNRLPNMAKTGIFLSDCMPCAWIASGNKKNAAPCSNPLTQKAYSMQPWTLAQFQRKT